MLDLRRVLRLAVVVLATAACTSPWALIPVVPSETVDEYTNDSTGHFALRGYFDGKDLGAGWRRTGWYFEAFFASDSQYRPLPVCHFRAPSIDGHYYTADPSECESVKHAEGWVYEGIAFYALTPTNGACQGSQIPVFGLYNNRERFGDPGHRFATDASVRAQMVAKGWTEYGPVFCTSGASLSFTIGQTRPPACSAGTDVCTRLTGLAPLANDVVRSFPPDFTQPNPFFPSAVDAVVGDRTGLRVYTAQLDTRSVAEHSFISGPGIFINGADRIGGFLAAIDPTYVLPQANPETTVYPWRDSSLRRVIVRADFTVTTIARVDGSHAYGHPLLRWVDSTSGHSLLMTLQAFGTLPSGEYAGRHDVTGEAIVSTAFGPNPGFGQRLSGDFRFCDASPCKADFSPFAFQLGRADMTKALARARLVDPALSPDPSKYYISLFMFHNETFLDARLGMSLYSASLEILPQ